MESHIVIPVSSTEENRPPTEEFEWVPSCEDDIAPTEKVYYKCTKDDFSKDRVPKWSRQPTVVYPWSPDEF